MSGHVVGREFGAEQTVDLRDPNRNRRAIRGRAGNVDEAADGGDARLGGQLDEPAHGPIDVVAPVGAATEASGGLARQVEALDGAGDRRRIPPRHLQQHLGRGIGDLGRGATHDSCKRDDRVARVGDDPVVGHERAFDVVEGHQGFAVAGAADIEPTVGDGGEVERVVGLAEFEHHIVRDVDDRVDRTHTELDQPLLHPRRRLPDTDVAEHRGDEAAAQLGILDPDVEKAVDRLVGGGDLVVREAELDTQRSGEIAGNAGDRHGIGTVGVDLEIPQHIGLHADRLGEGHAEFGTVDDDIVQDVDAVIAAGEPDLVGCAAHAVRHLAAHLPLGDLHAVGHDRADRGERDQVADRHVERTAAHLERLPVASVDIDELDLVGVGVRSEVEHLRKDDTVDDLADDLHLLDGEPERAQGLAQLDGITIDVGRELAEPGQGDLHQNCLRKRTSLLTSSRMSSSS